MNAQQLKNSILQMAVQGKLVPQDPNDEPASVLLDRIRKEKEKLIKEGKIKKEKNPSYIFRGEDNLPYEKVGKNGPVCIADEVPFEIPDSWAWCKLSFVTYPVGNKDNQILSKTVKSAGKIPVVSQGADLIEGYCDDDKKLIDDLPLVMFGDHTRNVKYIDFPFVIGADGTKFHKVLICDAKYIFYWMSYAALNLRNRGYARHYSLLVPMLIPIPPIEEQKRIVNKIESLIPLVKEYNIKERKLRNLNESFPELLRKSILQQAVMGKLVPQDPNDELASVLLEQIRAEKDALIKAGKIKKDKHESIIYRRDNSYYETTDGVEKCIDDELPFDIPDNWTWERINNIFTVIRGSSPRPKGSPLFWSSTPTDKHWITIKDITDFSNNGILEETHEYLTELGAEKSTFVSCGEIIIAVSGSTTGKFCVLGIDGYIYDGLAAVINPTKLISTGYLYVFFSWMYEKYNSLKVGSAFPNINTDVLKNTLIPLPPLDEQSRIVRKIEEMIPLYERLI